MTGSRAQAGPPAPAPYGRASRPQGATGRPRDERATEAIAAAALRQLSNLGYSRMSMDSVASEAGVSRATVYRRYRDKADLVTAAIAGRAPQPSSGQDPPLEQLVRFIEEFDERFAESCLEVIGSLLASREAPGALALHRERVVGPRMASARALLERAKQLGHLAPDADLDVVLQMLLGAVLARRVAGVPRESGWARRAVGLACRGAGGVTPERSLVTPGAATR